MRLIEYPDRAAQAEALALMVAADLLAVLGTDGHASLALPGGTTPAAFMQALARQPLDWARVTVFPADERWVPADHPRSNAALIRNHLLRDAAACATVIDLYDDAPTPQDGLVAVTARLTPHLPPDVVLLGMGNDLHMASLFPDAPGITAALSPDAPPVMAMQGPPPEREPRISLTLPSLIGPAGGAGRRHLLIAGADKRAALDAAGALPGGTDPATAPILAMLPILTVHWAP